MDKIVSRTEMVDLGDERGPHAVFVGNEGFECQTCGILTPLRTRGDGYPLTRLGAQQWHRASVTGGSVLTETDVVDLGRLVDAARREALVAWDTHGVYEGRAWGTARHLVVDRDRPVFLPVGHDVRDAYLRITTSTGWDYYMSVAEVVDRMRNGWFVLDYVPPKQRCTHGND